MDKIMDKINKKVEVLTDKISSLIEELDNQPTHTYRMAQFAKEKKYKIEQMENHKQFLLNMKEMMDDKSIFLNNIAKYLLVDTKYELFLKAIRLKDYKDYKTFENYEKQFKSMKILNENNLNYVIGLFKQIKNHKEVSRSETKDLRKEEFKRLKIAGYFPTPEKVIDTMLLGVKINEGDTILEPSAGSGDIANFVKKFTKNIDCVEINYKLREYLKEKNHNVIGKNIYNIKDKKYDWIIMNPPFEKKEDIKQVRYCFDNLLKKGGTLISVLSTGALTNSSKINVEFEKFVNENGSKFSLPQKSFRDSGTNVSTMFIELKK